MGLLWLCAQSYQRAEEAFSYAIVSGGAGPTTYFFRGVANQGLGRPELAIADFRTAKAAPYFVVRSLGSERAGNIREALRDVGLALQIDPALASAQLAAGRMYMENGDWAAAVDQLELARSSGQESQSPELWRNLGYATYRASGDRDAAVRLLERAIAIAGDNAQTFLDLADVYDRSGDSGMAARWYATALAEFPDDDYVNWHAAVFYNAHGEPQRTVSIIESRIARAQGLVFGEEYFYLGLAYEQMGKLALARSAYERASRLYPTDQRWIRELNRLTGVGT